MADPSEHQHRLEKFLALPEAAGKQRAAALLAAQPSVTEAQAREVLPAMPPDDPAYVEREARRAERDQHLAAGGTSIEIMDGGFLPAAFGLMGKPGGKPLDGGEAMSADEVAAAVNAEFGAKRG